ncbi:MAG: hypothetical protein ACFFFY_04055, partial [Promethearchaeota archaeon]
RMRVKNMGEISKNLKIVIIVNVVAALVYGILQTFFTEAYLMMVEQPTPDVHFTRVGGGTLLVLVIFGIYSVLKKSWDEFKLLYEFVIVYLIMLLILDIVYFATFTISATNFTNTLIATILTAVLIVVDIFFYLKEQK